MSEININEEVFRDYLLTSNRSTLRQFLEQKRQKNFGELFGYAEVIKTSLSTVGQNSGFLDYFSKLKLLKTREVYSVWSTPAAYHWCAMTRILVDAILHPPSSSTLLNHYLEFLNLDLERAVISHLNDFGRFVASAYLQAGTAVHFDVPVRISLPNTLPGSGIMLHYMSPAERQPAIINLSSLDQAAIEKINALRDQKPDESDHLLIQSVGLDQLVALRMLRWHGEIGDIIIDSFEPCLRLPYVESWPRIQSTDELERFLKILELAIGQLIKYDAKLASEIVALTYCVTPMNSIAVEAEMSSGTSSAIFGACFLSLTAEPLFMAEMLLHEFCHNKLRLFEEEFPLLLSESQNMAEFYSPWRDEPRPLEGIQHGLFVFSSIACFWLSVYRDPSVTEKERGRAQQRVATLLGQLRHALAEFRRFAKLTSYGRVFLATVTGQIQDLERQTRDWDLQNMLPFFSGTLRDNSLKRLPLAEALSRHRTNWERQFRGVGHGHF